MDMFFVTVIKYKYSKYKLSLMEFELILSILFSMLLIPGLPTHSALCWSEVFFAFFTIFWAEILDVSK